jgi:hypothetical protein
MGGDSPPLECFPGVARHYPVGLEKGYCELKPAREDEFEEQYGLRRTE